MKENKFSDLKWYENNNIILYMLMFIISKLGNYIVK